MAQDKMTIAYTTQSGILTRQFKLGLMDSIISRLYMMSPNIEPRPIESSLVQNLTVTDINGHKHYLTLTLKEPM